MPTCGEGCLSLELVANLVHQRVVVLLVGEHFGDVTLLSLLYEVVEPAAIVARLGLLLDHESSAAHLCLLVGHEQVLELLDGVLVHNRHDRVGPAFVVFIIECRQSILDVVESEHWVAEVRLVAE